MNPQRAARHPQPDPRFPAEFPAPWAHAWGEDRYGLWMAFRLWGVVQCLRWIMPGEFLMGSSESKAERGEDETQHRVILSRGYWLADTACTQALWQAVTGDNPSRFKGAERPVESVSWDEVQHFIDRLNTVVPGGGFRLPTEAEWEYACRADSETIFWSGERVTWSGERVTWSGEQVTPEQIHYGGKETVEVKALPCNGWGLYQMHGNVWEWCRDWYGDYPTGSVVDPEGPDEGRGRVRRGGAWLGGVELARSAQRGSGTTNYGLDQIGFRLALGESSSERPTLGENQG